MRLVEIDLPVGPEPGDHGEGGLLGRTDPVQGPVGGRPEEVAVDRDHLAVEPVQRAEAGVSLGGELRERQVPVVGTVEQGRDGGGLEQRVVVVPGVEVGPPHRLHVERAEGRFLDHGRTCSSTASQPRSRMSSTSVKPSSAP